jgi:hypothetical protein
VRIQLTRAGSIIDVSASELQDLQRQFHERYCILLRQFVEPDLARALQERIAGAEFYDKHNVDVGDEARMKVDSPTTVLEFLMNDPRLYALIRSISGVDAIGSFKGRVYSLMPNTGQYADWHNDMVTNRLCTNVINLSSDVYEGGLLQFKRVDSDEIVTEVHNTGVGDATLFKIDHSLKHRVTPITGTVRRTVYAGWFLSEPDFSTLLRERFDQQGAVA